MASLVGETLAGKYRLDAELGRGGMGAVYRARHVSLGTDVAVKVLHEELCAQPGLVERFVREARAATLVRHPNVVEILDVGEDPRGPFIVQELLEGENLEDYVRARGGKLSFAETVEMLSPVIEAVAEAHASGVVHRDIKPENVFVSRARGKAVPKLLDFGISQIRKGDVRVTATGVTMGTPAYMAPEQIRAAHTADARSDVWSLGVMLFELLSGRLPFVADSAGALFVAIVTEEAPLLSSVDSTATASATRIVARCLRNAQDRRYPSASELLRDLQLAVLDEEIEPTQRHSLPPRLQAPDLESQVRFNPADQARVAAFGETMPGAGPPAVPDLDLPPSEPRRAPAPPKPAPASAPKLDLAFTPPRLADGSAPPPPVPPIVDPAARPPSAPDLALPNNAPAPAPAPAQAHAHAPALAHAPAPAPAPAPAQAPAHAPALALALGPAPAPAPRDEALDMAAGFHQSGPSRIRRPQAAAVAPIAPRGERASVTAMDTDAIIGLGIVGLGAVLGVAALMRTVHRAGGWPIHKWLNLEGFSPSLLAGGGVAVAALGGYLAFGYWRHRAWTGLAASAGVLLAGLFVLGEAGGMALGSLVPLGLGVAAAGVAAGVLRNAWNSWQTIGGKMGALFLSVAGGAAVFVMIELFAGVG